MRDLEHKFKVQLNAEESVKYINKTKKLIANTEGGGLSNHLGESKRLWRGIHGNHKRI